MDKLQQAKDILNSNNAYIKAEKEAIYKHLQDPRLTTWKTIKFNPISELLQLLGITINDLKNALKSYPRQAKECAKHIKICTNELGNHMADLVNNKYPDKALQSAKNLDKMVHKLEGLKDTLYKQTILLLTVDETLRQSLTIEKFLPFARHLAQKQQHLFDRGLEVYRLIANDPNEEDTPLTLDEMGIKATNLQSRFKNIDVLGLPRLSEEIIFHYIEIGTETIKQLQLFVKSAVGIMATEIGTADNLAERLSALSKATPQTLLADAPSYALTLSNLIVGLYHKRALKETMSKISETIEFLNIYHLALKNKIIVVVKEQMAEPNSPINPSVIADKMTRSFFTGPKGMIRSMKLMVNSLTGHEAINQIELQLILEKTIHTCKTFYGNSPKDITELKEFIDNLIQQYQKPFPYDNIFTLAKQTIAEYGNNIDNAIKQYDIKKEFMIISKADLPPNFGQLTTKLITKKNALAKANK